MDQKNPGKAIQRVNAQITRAGDLPAFHALLGRIYLSQNDLARAESEYQKAVSLDPKDDAQRLALAEFYGAAGKPDRTVAVLQELVQKNPGNAGHKKRLALAYLNQKAYDKSMKQVEEVLKADSKDNEAKVIKARILMAQNRAGDAAVELQAVVNSDHNSAQARYLLGMAYLQDKKGPQAESAWNEAVRINPRFIAAYAALIQYKLDNSDPDGAIRYGRDAVKADRIRPTLISCWERLTLPRSTTGRRLRNSRLF